MMPSRRTAVLASRRDLLKGAACSAVAVPVSTAIGTAWMLHAPALLLGGTKAEANAHPVIETSGGRIRGAERNRVAAFKGIAYGASTEGARRFMPPEKPQAWAGVRDAFAPGPRCYQPRRAMIPEMRDAFTSSGPMSEDCLTLNVWAPASAAHAKHPVMVWFHGGGMRTGGASSILYDGTELARKHGVVVVGVNHRLNAFGFLYLAELGGEKFAPASNAGMLDLIAALEWVRDNIAGFGGDPGNVTIFGQSGGGGKVSTLQGMPQAKGLFHKMIVQSTISDTALWGMPAVDATRWAEVVLARLGLKATQVSELQQLPAEKLLAALTTSDGAPNGAAAETARDAGAARVVNEFQTKGDISLRLVPVVDGRTLPVNPFDPVAPELSAEIPIMVGSVECESVPYANPQDAYWSTGAIDDEGLTARVKSTLRVNTGQAEQVIALYRKGRPRTSNMDLAVIIASDAGTLRLAGYTIAERKAAQQKAAAYQYYFDWYSPLRQGKVRCMHGMELPFVFDHPDAADWMTGTGKDRYALASKMSSAWVAFARSGNPNHSGIPKWQPFDERRRATMIFGGTSRAIDDPYRAERLALQAIRKAQDLRPR